jgi:hypothetical protein
MISIDGSTLFGRFEDGIICHVEYLGLARLEITYYSSKETIGSKAHHVAAMNLSR